MSDVRPPAGGGNVKPPEAAAAPPSQPKPSPPPSAVPAASSPSANSSTMRSPNPAPEPVVDDTPSRMFLVSYPKIVFLYPTLIAAILAALVLTFYGDDPLTVKDKTAVVVSVLFLAVLAVNLVVFAFDFPRTTSLTLFFFLVAVGVGLVLIFVLRPNWLPALTGVLTAIHPLANATFYWIVVATLAILYVAMAVSLQFDYWEVTPNELLHHHGFLSNLERFPAPQLRVDKEINDVFEYMLLGSGRLILQSSDERRAIILDNVPMIRKKEAKLTKMLGALQVQLRP